jgi:hypothetical protein
MVHMYVDVRNIGLGGMTASVDPSATAHPHVQYALPRDMASFVGQ